MNDKTLQAIIKLRDEVSKPLKQVQTALKDTSKVTESMTKVQDQNSNAMNDAKKVMKEYEKTQKEAAEATKKHKQEVKEASATLRNFGGSVLGIVGGGLVFATKKAAEFEYAMTEVGAISKANKQELGKLTEEAKRLGATTKFTAAEAAAGMQKFAMAGYDVNEIMAATGSTLILATAGNTDLALACDIVSDAMTGLKLNAQDTERFVNIMTATITGSNTDIAMLGETMKYVAPVAGSLGVSFEDLALAAGLMGNAGVKASQAGTSLRGGLSRLIKPPKMAADAMEKYGISISKTKDGGLDLIGTMQTLRTKMNQLDPVTRSAALAAIFGQEAYSGWSEVVTASDEDFNKLKNSIADSAGEADRIAEAYNNTAVGAFRNLSSAVEGVVLNIGQAFVPMMKNAAEWLSKVATAFTELDPKLQENVAKFLAVVTAVAGVLLVIGLLSPIITGVVLVFKALAVVGGVVAGIIAFICTPAGALIALMLAITAAVLWLRDNAIKNFDDFKKKVSETAEKAKSIWQGVIDVLTSPIKAVINISKNIKEKVSKSGNNKSKSKDGKRSAYGTKRVVGNDIPYKLHQGEKVLSRTEADNLEKGIGSGGFTINIEKMTVRKDSDINEIARELADRLNRQRLAFAGGKY